MELALLHAALFTPTRLGWGLPALFESEPGTAKTSVIEDYAHRCGWHCEVLSPGERGEGAFGVVPVPLNGVLTYPPPEWAAKIGPSGLVFTDEVTTAPPLIQAPMLGLLSAKRIGSMTLAGGVRIIGACNPPEQAANGFDLSAPLANRFGWLHWAPPSADEHTAFMLGQANGTQESPIDVGVEERRVQVEWVSAFAWAVGLETTFLGAQQHWKNKCPKAGDPKAGRAWPSDRSWEMATRALASAKVHGLTAAERDAFVSGFVGAEAYEAFATWIEEQDLPNSIELLDRAISFEHNPKRLDRTAAILMACTAYVTNPKADKRAERAERLWEMLSEVGSSSLDVIVPAGTALINATLHTSKAAVKVLARIHPVIEAAKLAKGGR